jgi:tRNA uridine 5-carbamoylmethylation protein Kti12
MLRCAVGQSLCGVLAMTRDKRIIIMRGPPGAGKTTLANKIQVAVSEREAYRLTHYRCGIASMDHFRYVMGAGQYRYEKEMNSKCAAVCFGEFLMMVNEGYDWIIIDNTNIYLKSYADYIRANKVMKYGYTIQQCVVTADINLCVHRNTHNVPRASIEGMLVDFQKDPSLTHLNLKQLGI